MRVAVNAWFWNSLTTGSGQYTRRLVEHLAAARPDVEILLVAPRGWGYRASGAKSRLPERPQPETDIASGVAKVWFEQIAFPRACAHLRADLAHVPYWAPPLRPAVPTLVTIHDLISLLLPEYRGGSLVRLYTALVSRASRSAALVLTDSEASRRDIVAHLGLPAERVRIIHLAADERYTPNAGSPPPRESLPPAGGSRKGVSPPHRGEPEGGHRRIILYLGGFDVRKNVATVLEAYALAAPIIGEDCPLVIAGRLPERDTAFTPDPRRLARELGVDERLVHFVGFVDEADKPALYRGAVAFIFPSRYEGFGLPPLEALACGTPVVGSNAASLPGVVGDAGVLLAPDDARGMAQALVRLVRDGDFRADLSRRALAQAARFSWERTARETLAAYEEVMTRDGMDRAAE